MRTPHLVSAMFAAASMMGGNHISAQTPLELTFTEGFDYLPTPLWRPFGSKSGDLSSSHRRVNQRVARKNRRRAHAAGSKKAFN